MRPNLKYIIVTFLVGLLVGGLIGRLMTPWHYFRHGSPEKREERMLKHFSSKLNLTLEQKDKVGAIFKAGHEDMEKLMAESRAKFDDLRNKTADEVKKVLNPDQQEKFNKMHEKFEKRWKQHAEMSHLASPPDEKRPE